MIVDQNSGGVDANNGDRSLQSGGAPGQNDDLPGPEDAETIGEGKTKKGRGQVSMEQYWRSIQHEGWDGYDVDTAKGFLDLMAKDAGWKHSGTTSGEMWADKKTGLTIRISDYHAGKIYIYAERYGEKLGRSELPGSYGRRR
jgi:hypothetical protein